MLGNIWPNLQQMIEYFHLFNPLGFTADTEGGLGTAASPRLLLRTGTRCLLAMMWILALRLDGELKVVGMFLAQICSLIAYTHVCETGFSSV